MPASVKEFRVIGADYFLLPVPRVLIAFLITLSKRQVAWWLFSKNFWGLKVKAPVQRVGLG
jgi:hypothetical protein